MGLSPFEIGLALLVALLLFGPGRIAGAGKGLGEAIRNFKLGLSNIEDDIEASGEDAGAKATATSSPQVCAPAAPAIAVVKKAAKRARPA